MKLRYFSLSVFTLGMICLVVTTAAGGSKTYQLDYRPCGPAARRTYPSVGRGLAGGEDHHHISRSVCRN